MNEQETETMQDNYACLKLENQLCFPLYVCSKEIVRRYKPFLDEEDYLLMRFDKPS